jgi:serine/threonine-protein kinase
MTPSTAVQRIARAAVGMFAASLIVGQATPAFADAGPPGNPWDTATAVFTDTDGKQTTVKANSVAYCISVAHSIKLSDTQDIPFEKIRRFEVTRSDKLYQNEGKADLAVTTLGGRTLTGTVGSNCDFLGENELGRFSLYPQKLKSVEFHRIGEPPAPTGPCTGPNPRASW